MTSPGIKDDFLLLVGEFTRDKSYFFYSLPVLDFRTGTKDSICPGFKHNRDKCMGTKACFVVVGGVSSIRKFQLELKCNTSESIL